MRKFLCLVSFYYKSAFAQGMIMIKGAGTYKRGGLYEAMGGACLVVGGGVTSQIHSMDLFKSRFRLFVGTMCYSLTSP